MSIESTPFGFNPSEHFDSIDYGKVYPELIASYLGCTLDEVVWGNTMLSEFVNEDDKESWLEEPWSLPEGISVVLELSDVETQTLAIGWVGLCVTSDGRRFVAECNASPFLFYTKENFK